MSDQHWSQMMLPRERIEQLENVNRELREENERVRQANLDVMMHFEDMKAAKEKAEARVGELEEEMELFTAVAVMICQQESDEWDSDRLQTYKDYAEACGQRIAKLTPVNARSWLLRKQAEAMERAIDSSYGFTQMAQRLRQQADEIEKAGGEQ